MIKWLLKIHHFQDIIFLYTNIFYHEYIVLLFDIYIYKLEVAGHLLGKANECEGLIGNEVSF